MKKQPGEFVPRYTITPRLLGTIKEVARLTTELNLRRFPRPVLVEFERSARDLSAYSSTSIEGNPLPLTEVRRLLKNAPSNLRDSEREVLNYNEALIALREKKGDGPFDTTLILDIHRRVMTGLLDRWRAGKLRQEPVVVNDPVRREIDYLPPDHADVPSLMEALTSWVGRMRHELDPLIVAGIFHRQFVIIHPFIDGNGRTARLATKFLLADMGLDTFELFSFENYYNRQVSRYFAAVGSHGNYYDLLETVDFTAWLEYFADGIADELQRVKKELEKHIGVTGPELTAAERLILSYIEEHGSITDREYATLTDRAKATRALDFKRLTEKGRIIRRGGGRNTKYVRG